MVRVTGHAISRYQERVRNLPDEEVVALLSSPAIEAAAAFGAPVVRLATRHRIIIKNGTVVTVLPAAGMYFEKGA